MRKILTAALFVLAIVNGIRDGLRRRAIHPPKQTSLELTSAAKRPALQAGVRFPTGRMATGVAMLVVSASFASTFVFERDTPRFASALSGDVAMVFPAGIRTQRAGSIDVRATIETAVGATSCNPVDVTVVFTPQESFWRLNRGRLDRRVDVALAAVGRGVSDVKLGLVSARDAGEPEEPAPVGVPTVGGARVVRVQERAVRGFGRAFAVTVERWDTGKTPMVLKFRANWSVFRSVGSCYIGVPQLTQGVARYAGLDALGVAEPDREPLNRLTERSGEVTLQPRAGLLDLQSAEPKPKFSGPGFATWGCANIYALSERFKNSSTEPTESDVRFDCSASVVLRSGFWNTVRAFGFFLVGILAALGAQLVYDASMAAHRARQWTRQRGLAIGAVALYVGIAFALVRPEQALLALGAGHYLMLAASLALGYLVRSWWVCVLPAALWTMYAAYYSWFSFAARNDFAAPAALAWKGAFFFALQFALFMIIGRALDRRRRRRLADASYS